MMRRLFVCLTLVCALAYSGWRCADADGAVSEGGDSAAVSAVNGLALKLYGELASPGENLCFSPYSVSSAFAMAYAGAGGETAQEMRDAFGFVDGIHASNELLMRNVTSAPDDAGELLVANSVWPQRGYRLLEPFVETLRKNYDTEITPQDFVRDSELARESINKWVDVRTKGRIKDLMAPGTLDSDARLVLVNAVYFNAQWLSEFPRGATETADFYTTSPDVTEAEMMNRVGAYAYFEDDDAQAVKIPYRRGAYSMTIVLPRERDGIGELERSLAQARWPDSFAGEMERRMVNLSVPRFRVESTFSLNRAVESIGAASAFNRETADFSGMNGRGDLYISEAVHKAFIDVNEDGTEAAASTALAVSRTSAALDESPPVVFRADHPFIFVIRDEMSGAVLFMGKVARPGRD